MWKRVNNCLIGVSEIAHGNYNPADYPNIHFKTFKKHGKDVAIFDGSFYTTSYLRRLGFNAPSFEETYQYPGFKVPMAHQRETVKFFLDHPRCFCCNGLGTGKTLSAFWAAECLRGLGQIRRVLVVAPKSAMRNAWESTIISTCPGVKFVVLRGERRQKIAACKDVSNTYIIVNPESLHIIKDSLPEVDLVIADESTKFKTWKAQRTQALNYIALQRRVWLMTGTPAPQAPTDAYAQIRILRGGKYMSFTSFRDKTMYQINKFRWKAKSVATKVVSDEMQPCIRFSRDECLDLPDLAVIDYKVPLSEQQKKVVKQLQDQALALIDGEVVTAVNAATVLSKCLQALTGVVYGNTDNDGERQEVPVDSTELFEAVGDIVDQSEQPVLIYVAYRSSVKAMLDYFAKDGVPAAGITADTTVDERTEIFEKIQSGELKVMVAVAQTVAHGITLTNANTIVWLTPPMSFETYDQANGRIYRKGQTRKCTIYRVYQDWVTRLLLKRLDERTELQNTLLEILSKKDVDI